MFVDLSVNHHSRLNGPARTAKDQSSPHFMALLPSFVCQLIMAPQLSAFTSEGAVGLLGQGHWEEPAELISAGLGVMPRHIANTHSLPLVNFPRETLLAERPVVALVSPVPVLSAGVSGANSVAIDI